jgi:hypothetical protein
LQYSGRHGEAESSTQAVEALMDYQLTVGEMLVPLSIWLLDPGKYGFGVVGHYWDREVTQVRKRVTKRPTFMGVEVPFGKPEVVDVVEQVTSYEGNRLYNVRPQDFFPDPAVSLWKFGSGEFCGRYFEMPWHAFIAGVQVGKYFNEKSQSVAQSTGGNSSWLNERDGGSSYVSELPGEDTISQMAQISDSSRKGMVKGHEIYVKLSPNAWGLGAEGGTEVWVFTLTAQGVVIGAQPLGEYHGKFGFDILEYEPNGYNIFSASLLERIQPMNDTLTWLINTHFYNVRASLNNMFLVDPSMVVMKDFENPKPGKLLRLKEAMYGRDVRQAVAQFQVADVTGRHPQDAQIIADMMQRLSGVTDNIMGMVNQGGRKTATEVRTSTSFGVNRLKTVCEYFSAMGFAPMAQKLLQRTQQHYSAEKKYRIVGDIAQFGEKFLDVSADSIAGFYDFVPVDGTLPVDRYAQANLWQGLLGQLRNYPEFMQSYDIPKIIGWVGQLAGLKNINQFRVKIVPDDLASQQMQAGNIIPMKGQTDLTRVPNPAQNPGMGATG